MVRQCRGTLKRAQDDAQCLARCHPVRRVARPNAPPPAPDTRVHRCHPSTRDTRPHAGHTFTLFSALSDSGRSDSIEPAVRSTIPNVCSHDQLIPPQLTNGSVRPWWAASLNWPHVLKRLPGKCRGYQTHSLEKTVLSCDTPANVEHPRDQHDEQSNHRRRANRAVSSDQIENTKSVCASRQKSFDAVTQPNPTTRLTKGNKRLHQLKTRTEGICPRILISGQPFHAIRALSTRKAKAIAAVGM